ncbi:MAG: sialidase family protein [Bacteroidota bacterium]
MKKQLLLFAFMITSAFSFAQWSHLSHSQLSNIEPSSSIYTGTSALIGTESGIFRSSDNGLNWQFSNTGIDSSSLQINSLIMYNNQPWICNGSVYKSTNDGQSWTKATLTGLPQGSWNE